MARVTGIGELASAIGAARPSGDNIEYDQIFVDMQLAAVYSDEQQVGDAIIEAGPPDYAALAASARAVLSQSHDLRAAIFLAEAALALDGLPGFAAALDLIATYLRDEWDGCHPQPDEDDGDVTMRVNAVSGLADRQRIVAQLRRAPLTQSRAFGRMSLRDVEIVDGRLPPPASGPAPDINTVQAAFKDTPPEDLAALRRAIAQARAATAAIETAFATRTPGTGPALDPLDDTLRATEQVMARFFGADEAAAPPAEGDDAPAPASAPAAPARSVPGTISNPDDVIVALDRIMAYYRNSEPSSPIPVILGRARRLVRADFMTIIKDMASDGLQEVRQIGGIADDDD